MALMPSWWQTVVLSLAVYRVMRLVGWDDFPLAVRLRVWATAAVWDGDEWVLGRPTLAKFLSCPFCLGWWLCLAAYGGWLLWPQVLLHAAVPFALSAIVGLVAKNLDA